MFLGGFFFFPKFLHSFEIVIARALSSLLYARFASISSLHPVVLHMLKLKISIIQQYLKEYLSPYKYSNVVIYLLKDCKIGIPRVLAVQSDALQKEVQLGVFHYLSVSSSSYLVILSLIMVRKLKKIHASDNSYQDSLKGLISLEYSIYRTNTGHASLIQILLSHLGLLSLAFWLPDSNR